MKTYDHQGAALNMLGAWNSEKGEVRSFSEVKHGVYMKGAPGANEWGWLGTFYFKNDADAALEVYRIMMGRDPKTGEKVS